MWRLRLEKLFAGVIEDHYAQFQGILPAVVAITPASGSAALIVLWVYIILTFMSGGGAS